METGKTISRDSEAGAGTGGVAGRSLRIDAHQHFWKFDPIRDGWIGPEMSAIQKDFLPGDLYPVLQAAGVDGCVVVQSDQSEDENEFQLANAARHVFIKGVVGWIDLQSPAVEEQLAKCSRYTKLKGFRHVLQGEQDRALMLKPSFKRGIGLLKKWGYTYDVLIYPDQLGYTREFAAAFPDQPMVIDHMAKPDIRGGKLMAAWKKAIREVAGQENVCCKISGMVTEADWITWTAADLRPYLDTVVEAFGTGRIMYGSDWPVCLVAATYGEVMQVVRDYFSSFSTDEQDAFFGGNATRFYNL